MHSTWKAHGSQTTVSTFIDKFSALFCWVSPALAFNLPVLHEWFGMGELRLGLARGKPFV